MVNTGKNQLTIAKRQSVRISKVDKSIEKISTKMDVNTEKFS
jgi:hypothetical protein